MTIAQLIGCMAPNARTWTEAARGRARRSLPHPGPTRRVAETTRLCQSIRSGHLPTSHSPDRRPPKLSARSDRRPPFPKPVRDDTFSADHQPRLAMPLRVAIVGAGPAGFFLAERLLSQSRDDAPIEVDLFERLP